MKILVCLGGLKYGDIATAFAAKISKVLDSEISLLHVVPHIHTHGMRINFGAEPKSPQEITELKERAKRILKKEGITKPNTIRRKGEPVKEILNESRKGYHMIITGSSKLKGAEKALFESVSYQVAEYAKIPVLIVKKNVDI
jgi:nucleotide-binding universal stress UspA family protein